MARTLQSIFGGDKGIEPMAAHSGKLAETKAERSYPSG
jgi:hypothetical protein